MREGKRSNDDRFFTAQNCDRCGGSLSVRILSWFNSDVLCMNCHEKESAIRQRLREQGKDDRKYEGCGYIPD